MAARTNRTTEVEETYEMDDDVQIVEEPELTKTDNFMGNTPVIVDEVQDLGVVVGERSMVVRTIDDIGPVYYGADLIEMKKGVKYEVPGHIYEWLKARDLLWEQQ